MSSVKTVVDETSSLHEVMPEIKLQLKSKTGHDFSDYELEKILALGKSEHNFTSDQTLSYFLEFPPKIYGPIKWDKANNVISPYDQERMDANQPGINVSGFSFNSYYYDDSE